MFDVADPPKSLAAFVNDLWESGQIAVFDLDPADKAFPSNDDAWLQLQWLASEVQTALPGDNPGLSRPAAEWALAQFYRACRFLVHRAHGEEILRGDLNRPAPEAPSPAVCYSVDLTFRFLPDLHRMATNLSTDDPLVAILETWGVQWPLSSVGMKFTPPKTLPDAENSSEQNPGAASLTEASPQFDLDPWWPHDCLRRMYVDRVLRRGDLTRLADPRIADAVRQALGHHPDLAPAFAASSTTDS